MYHSIERLREKDRESKEARKRANGDDRRERTTTRGRRRGEGDEKRERGREGDAKLIDNFSHESDVTSLKTPF